MIRGVQLAHILMHLGAGELADTCAKGLSGGRIIFPMVSLVQYTMAASCTSRINAA